MPRLETFDYIRGSDLGDIGLFIEENGTLLDLSSGYTFQLIVGDGGLSGGTDGFAKTSPGITGATGSGTQFDGGVPNLVIKWETTGELNVISAGHYPMELIINRTVDSRQYRMKFLLDVFASLE